ncbi:amidohydrolase/deacetylase family metallohydrolase [Fodinibius salsisoli]|uniref:Amidohydrolase/deacetylase family metallohydrolase n=1 Tax=Fodinibius salsisoli TaxID=2820877 RepID=A0ABT3PQ03_9BACT|nr:amidohydrolase/deacetylase family metallohydrolase [Fodinibius salsisoli]MCW9707930.1 amidohydrolase/deacetylase family metallohydrolase [Fodinibius salsisoli]
MTTQIFSRSNLISISVSHFKGLYHLLLSVVLLVLCCSVSFGQSYDMVIKGGHVIDPRNQIDGPMDIAVVGDTIARVATDIPANEAERVIDAEGLYVTPGLIDIHTHNFWGTKPDAYLSNSFASLPPDGFTFRAGVTTVVDAGSAGWKNFRLFKEHVVDKSKTRVLAFLNIVGSGMKGGAVEQNMVDMNPRTTAIVAGQYPEIVGIKLAHYNGHDFTPAERAVEAGEEADVPVMVDFGSADPPLSIKTLLLDVLRAGDIYTHMYGGGRGNRQAVVDENGQLRDGMLEAQEKGRIFDIGHGGGSFFYPVAIPAFEQGLKPNTISTDLHTGSMNGGMKNMLNVVSKMMDMGMSLQEVILTSTWKPAQVIQREELGHLSEGAVADIAIFTMREGDFGFLDSDELLKSGATQKLETEVTIRAGEVVYDLNGLAAPQWNDEKQ